MEITKERKGLPPERPLVSIGLPTYNRPELLERALRNICQQTWAQLEIIVSDNASSDPRVADILNVWSAKDPRIRVFYQKVNGGALSNFFFVLQQARADWFMWAADDDRIEPWLVERCMHALLSDSRNVLCVAETQYCDEEGRPMPAFSQGVPYREPTGLNATQRLEYLLRYNFDNMIYGLFRKDALTYKGDTFWKATAAFSGNEIPPLLLAAHQGEIIVLPEVGIFKTAAASVHAQACWEETGGRIPSTSRIRDICSARATWRYHEDALRGIVFALKQLELRDAEFQRLARIAKKRLCWHFFWLLLGFKPKRKLS